jgi:3-oxoacyl-[acyl-carrier protein] reductase
MTAPVTIVTGSASGIGLHLTTVLAARGHRIVATDLNERGLDEAREKHGWRQDQVVIQKLDVTREEDWERTFENAEQTFGRVELLLNVAGALKPGKVVDIEPRDVDLHLLVNVKGTVLGTRAAARRMVRACSGHIVNIGSLASLAPVPGLSLYCASKFAVRGFTLAAATELAEHGVFVTLVMPDAVQTPMLDLQVDYEEAAVTFSGDRALTVEDIERVIVDVVLPKHPLEITIPLGRGLLARAANSAPGVSKMLYPMLKKKGLAAQAKAKRA